MKNQKVKIGFLPLYIKLYDDVNPQMRTPMEAYMGTAISMLEAQEIQVVRADICRVKPEFDAAARLFAEADVDAVVTMHLAYSPSLESLEALLSLKVPIIVMDTTPSYDLTARMEYENCISPNHGIHGVQDMCCMLKSRGCPYWIEAGHLLNSDIAARIGRLCQAAKAAKAFKTARIGSVGGAFHGMGDFLVEPGELKSKIGAEVVSLSQETAEKHLAAVSESDIDGELSYDMERFAVEIKNIENYRMATKAGLALRSWGNDSELTALTVNFLTLDQGTGLPKMPFAELSKSMMRGIGYAGEGDVLTAGLVGALMSAYPNTTFTEMFCPDWKENIVMLSHMGEMNLNLASRRPLMTDCAFSYNSTGDTVAAYGALKAGNAVLVNLAPMGSGFSLIAAPVEMLDISIEFGVYRRAMQGYFRHRLLLPDFLKAYSMAGGTHHSALVYGADAEGIVEFGRMMGFESSTI